MKRIILILLLCLPMIAGAQTYSELQSRINANIWQDGTRFQTNTYRRFYSDTLNSLLNDMLDYTKNGFLPLTITETTQLDFPLGNIQFWDYGDFYITMEDNDGFYSYMNLYPNYVAFGSIDTSSVFYSIEVNGGAGQIKLYGTAANYNANYTSAMTTDRHIPDIGWVKGYVDTAAVSGSSYTFTNGLTESGGVVTFGLEDLEIPANTIDWTLVAGDDEDLWRLRSSSGSVYGQVMFDFVNRVYFGIGGTLTSNANFIADAAAGTVKFLDNRSTKVGVEYSDDYSAGFTSRSMVDKEYVDKRAKLSKYDATAAPGTGDDAADGYSVGSIWCDVTNDDAYICLDSTNGAAVWKKITP